MAPKSESPSSSLAFVPISEAFDGIS